MEKNTLIGLTLIGAVLVGFSLFNRPSEEQRARMQHYQDSIQAVQLKNEVAKEEARQMESLEASTDSASQLFASAQGTEQFYTLKNKLVELTFTNKGGRIYAAKLFDYNGQDGQPVVLFDNKDAGMSFDFSGKNENIITENLYFNAVESNDSTLVMRLQTASAGYIDFCYRLQRDAYMVNFTLQAHGMQNFFAPSVHSVDIRWNQDARQLEKGYSFENRYTTLTYKKKGKGTDYLSETRDADKEIEEKLDWVAFKNQFFSSVFIADEDFTDVHLTSNMQKEGSGYLKEYKADMTTFFDPTGQKATNMQFYFGPNHYKILQRTNHLATSDKDLDMQRLVYLGWPLFRWINRFFTIYIFDWLTNWGLSMGVVLLLMTIVLKLLVYPTTYKSYMSSAKMRVLKPYVDEINKKYPNKEDAMKKQQEIMGVYSKYGVSPMGGCLPMLIQMPVFIAMFNFVPNAIELRGQSFLWAPDLSTYDDVINWGFNIPLLGDHLSLFCLLFSATNILNTMYMMKQQNQATQEQMPGMKWMMYLMPVMFIFIFNNYSAGLNYYYFISGLISIIIMAVLRKTTDDKALLAKLEARAAANKNNPSKRSNMMAKLEALQKEQERIQKEREARLKR